MYIGASFIGDTWLGAGTPATSPPTNHRHYYVFRYGGRLVK